MIAIHKPTMHLAEPTCQERYLSLRTKPMIGPNRPLGIQTSKIYFTTGSTFLQSAQICHNQLLPADLASQRQLHALKLSCQLEKDCASSNSNFVTFVCTYVNTMRCISVLMVCNGRQACMIASSRTYAKNCLFMSVPVCQHACWHMLPPGCSPLLDSFLDLRKKRTINGSFQARSPNNKLVFPQFAFQEILHAFSLQFGFAYVLCWPQCPGQRTA